MKLGSNQLLEILPIMELYEKYNTHKRLRVFVQKGCECVVCGRHGALLVKTEGKDGSIHIDLYTEDFVLMTVDHITAKAVARRLGWNKAQIEALENKQPMCSPCNGAKSDKELSVEQMREKRCRNGYPHRVPATEVLRQLVMNTTLFGVPIKIATA